MSSLDLASRLAAASAELLAAASLRVPHKPLGSADDTAMPATRMLSSTLVHSSGVKSFLLAMAVSSELSALPGISAAYKRTVPRRALEGGAECLFDRLLCVREAKRTPIIEKKAQTLADTRDQVDVMGVFPPLISGRPDGPYRKLKRLGHAHGAGLVEQRLGLADRGDVDQPAVERYRALPFPRR